MGREGKPKDLCVLQPPNLNLRGPELLLGRDLMVYESGCYWTYRISKSQPLRTLGSKMKGIVQPQILRMGRTHMSTAFSVLPDIPTHRHKPF